MKFKASGMIFSLVLLVIVISFQIYQIQSLINLKKQQIMIIKHQRLFYFFKTIKLAIELSDNNLNIETKNSKLIGILEQHNIIYYSIELIDNQEIFCFIYNRIEKKVIDIQINECLIDNED